MARRLSLWSVTVPLAVVGSQVAHAAAYRVVAPNADERAHLLAETGHSYLAYLPLGLALCTVVVLLALVGEARRAARGAAGGLAPVHFALVAPLVFCFQEHFERLLHDGTFPWDAALQPTFLIGLALQGPFALLAYGLAYLLLRAARAVGRRLGWSSSGGHRSSIVVFHARPVDVPRLAALSLGFGTRGPPAPAC